MTDTADKSATQPGQDAGETQAGAGGTQAGAGQTQAGADPAGAPSEEELRAAYEAELSRITSSDLIVQTLVSLLNLGGRRLGLAPGSEGERDLEQVRDAIDGVRALMPIVERHIPAAQLVPLRDALAQLQMAYAREAGAKPQEGAGSPPGQPSKPQAGQPQSQTDQPGEQPGGQGAKGPGPAEASGRLWVPGR